MNPGVACINLAVARAIHDTAPEQTARFTKIRLKPLYEQIRRYQSFFSYLVFNSYSYSSNIRIKISQVTFIEKPHLKIINSKLEI